MAHEGVDGGAKERGKAGQIDDVDLAGFGNLVAAVKALFGKK